MRTLWPAKVLASEFSLPLNDKAKSAASRFLRNFTAFQKYIACIGNSKADISNPNLGAFGLVLDSQRQITSELVGPRPTHESSSPPPIKKRFITKDEQIVNDALLLLLRALTITIPNAQCKCSSARAPFDPVRFGTNTTTAHNDGYLQGINVEQQVICPKSNPKTYNGVYPILLPTLDSHFTIFLCHIYILANPEPPKITTYWVEAG
ncbi:hypothetical protein N7499_000426 [Penicillium canescens]|nr:hypothetical protein N7499_000426 [Penicillium canescens]KAJ6173257.1 hypothetical protein N7485_006069 [Penicillium canescens]